MNQILSRDELVEHVKCKLRPDPNPHVWQSSNSRESTTGSRARNNLYSFQKYTPLDRPIYQKVFFKHIAYNIQTFHTNHKLFVAAVKLPLKVLRAVVDAIDPEAIDPITESDIDIDSVVNRYPVHEQRIRDIVADITAFNSLCWEEKRLPVLYLYSLNYHYYCIKY